MLPVYVDFHCHPSLKPYARSFPSNQNSKNTCERSSIWHKIVPRFGSKLKNILIGITKFTQSDLTTLSKSPVGVIGASLYPLEKGFLTSTMGEGKLNDIAANIISGLGQKKIDFVQENKIYFNELVAEYNFYKQLDHFEIKVDDTHKSSYCLTKNFEQVVNNLEDLERTISVVLTIEGAHVFYENIYSEEPEAEILKNIELVKNWEFVPLFVSPAHHFYNGICGHAYSLGKGLQKFLNQKDGVDTGFTSLGYKSIEKLLDKSSGKRILIDIKHMSRISRRQYYELLKSDKYKLEQIPIVVSHGAVNGRPTVYSDEEHDTENGLFFGADINFYDDELVFISKSGGLFCIQLDERRSASKKLIRKARFKILKKKMLKVRSGFIWNQIEHVARALDQAGEPSWDCIAIGSDFDGIIDPLNGFWTAYELGLLRKYLSVYALKLLNSADNSLSILNKTVSADEIMEKLFTQNAMTFLKNNFK